MSMHSMQEDVSGPTFYIGQHETRRKLPVTEQILRQAQDLGVRFPTKCTP